MVDSKLEEHASLKEELEVEFRECESSVFELMIMQDELKSFIARRELLAV